MKGNKSILTKGKDFEGSSPSFRYYGLYLTRATNNVLLMAEYLCCGLEVKLVKCITSNRSCPKIIYIIPRYHIVQPS